MFNRKFQLKLLLCLIITGYSTGFSATEKPTITLVSEYNPPFAYRDKTGKFVGSAVDLLKPIMADAGININFKALPWKRALAELKKSNSLIYPLSRTAEREKSFSWIIPIHHMNFKLYSLKGRFNPDRKNIHEEDYSFSCVIKTVLCTALKAFGIPDENIVKLSAIDDKQMVEMLFRDRIDYIISTETGLIHQLEMMGIERSILEVNKHYNYRMTEYLAGSPEFNKQFIKLIQESAKDKLDVKNY